MSKQLELNTDELVFQTHENLKLLCQHDVPSIKNLAILMLALSRQLVMTVDPFHVEHIHDYE
ncbi:MULTISPECIES: hypothetical protein [unclassified Paenibacillus]|uniref:hypothetical protein n=1 Tax=unclassified Paenibacillus TaxID=185978 RepID=UPI001AE6259F|nr:MULTISPECIES: hypothetical protein [unclassified Paenibacillus]MBP1154092.1 hypothetical protein [Paenibacillus sp. PvP091]MBP1170523.1 hypothetical protein [Paenibacillus sp. PvR098]MBP2441551.1 hypothetical protein [Paenibacillus sp. PvP052]